MKHFSAPQNPQPRAMVDRVRVVVSAAAQNCECRQEVNEALQRFAELEQRRQYRRLLQTTRQHRTAITSLMELLAEVDEIDWQEPDRSVFAELAGLFDDIARHALQGASTMRQMTGGYDD